MSIFNNLTTLIKKSTYINESCYNIYITYGSYGEKIQRKQSVQYRKLRAITVKVTLSSARCDAEFHIRQ